MKHNIRDICLYQQCPRAYKLHVIEGVERKKTLSSAKARVIRSLIAWLYSKPFPILPDEILEFSAQAWEFESAGLEKELSEIAIQAKPATKNKPAEPPVTVGQQCLTKIREWACHYASIEGLAKVLILDNVFCFPLLDVEFEGNVDLVREVEGGTQLLFFSTSSTKPSQAFLQRDFRILLAQYASWKAYKTIPEAFCYWFPALEMYKRKTAMSQVGDMKGNPLLPVRHTEKDLREFEYELSIIAGMIEMQAFPMFSNSLQCSLCQFQGACLSVSEEKLVENNDKILDEME